MAPVAVLVPLIDCTPVPILRSATSPTIVPWKLAVALLLPTVSRLCVAAEFVTTRVAGCAAAFVPLANRPPTV